MIICWLLPDDTVRRKGLIWGIKFSLQYGDLNSRLYWTLWMSMALSPLRARNPAHDGIGIQVIPDENIRKRLPASYPALHVYANTSLPHLDVTVYRFLTMHASQ